MDANALLLLAQAASVPGEPAYRLSPANVFLMFFIMLGPLKLIGPAAAATRELAPAALRALAFKVFALSLAAVVLGGLLGSSMLAKWHIPVSVLELTAGLILALVSLQMVMAQYHEPPAVPAPARGAMHLVFPVSVTPYGIAVVILLLALAADRTRTLLVLGIAVAVLVLNLLAMLSARAILPWAGLPLQILGAVLGVLQVALGLMIMITALAAMGVGVSLA